MMALASVRPQILTATGTGRFAFKNLRRQFHDNALRWLGAADERPDGVVLDPPRAGAGRDVVQAIAGAGPRVVVYVACDPVALARDVALFASVGYRLAELRAFDTFPMTHHVETVAALVPITLAHPIS